MKRLVCSRCGAAITRSYERGRCVAADCEVSAHDRAVDDLSGAAIEPVPFVGLDDDDREGLALVDKMVADWKYRKDPS